MFIPTDKHLDLFMAALAEVLHLLFCSIKCSVSQCSGCNMCISLLSDIPQAEGQFVCLPTGCWFDQRGVSLLWVQEERQGDWLCSCSVASSTECCVLRVANFKCWKWLKFPVSDFSLADWQHLSDVWIITRLWCFLLVKMFSSTLKSNKLATQFMLQTWATELFIFFLVVFEFYKWIWWQLSLALVWCCDMIGGCCFCWSSWQLTNTSKRILKQHWYWLLLFFFLNCSMQN